MNIRHRKFLSVLIVIAALLGLLAATWPTVAQSIQPPRQPDRLRDPIGPMERAPLEWRQAAAQPANVVRPTGSNPGPWTLVAYASYRDSNWEIYTANGDGAGTARRTINPAADVTPNLNRGGTRIVFISDRDGNGEVYVMNADGSGQTRLTNTAANEYLPSWSPDGTKIVFYSYRNGNAEIYVMNADGSNQTRLTNNKAWDGHPAWSPDGTQIVFSSNRNGTYDLFKMSAQGTNQTQLTYGASYATVPDWSPDGSTIIFNYDANGDTFYDIATISANGGSYTPLSYAPAQTDEAGPKWDPSGHYYTFASIHWVYIQNDWYWDTAYVRARQIGGSDNWTIGTSSEDWYPDWNTTDVTAPASQMTALPQWTTTTAFNISWGGSDNSSGIASYDIQYRDGSGSWVDWLVGTTQTAATFNGANGHTYYFRSRARDYANNLESYPAGDGDTSTTVDSLPPSASAYSPAFTNTTSIPVQWSGVDTVSGINTYDVQYRDGTGGVWTDWLSNVTYTSTQFAGQLAHTYFFRARAWDKAGNRSAYSDTGDSSTTVYQYDLAGWVLNNRARPVVLAMIQSDPVALNTATSQSDGRFHVYYSASEVVTLTAARHSFGLLPPFLNMLISDTLPNPIFYLPPLDNVIADSHFESGDLSAWNPSGDLTPTLTSAAHTGQGAVLLGGSVPSDTVTTAPWRSTVEQTLNVSPTVVSGTLALLYHVEAAEPLSDTLTAYVMGTDETLTFTLPLTTSDWTQQWFDLSTWVRRIAE